MLLKIEKYQHEKSADIGLYYLATEDYCIAPNNISADSANLISNILEVNVIKTQVGGTYLHGILVRGNSNGLVVPYYMTNEEIKTIKESQKDLNILRLSSKYTAMGNLLVVNDKKGVASPLFDKSDVKNIEDVLGIELIQKKIMGQNLVGSFTYVNNLGGLAHPLIPQSELQELSNYFNLPFNITTVNQGIPYPKIGIISNSKGILVGVLTTGPELMRIYETFSGQSIELGSNFL